MKDLTLSKYSYIGDFKEGLAKVINNDNLCGFINKEGVELVHCIYKDVEDFSEGLAKVVNDENKTGFIDKNGNVVIDFNFYQANSFSNGYAVVNDEQYNYNIINKNGQMMLNTNEIAYISSFKNGYALAKLKEIKDPRNFFVDTSLHMYGCYKKISNFENGIAIVMDEITNKVYIIDDKGNKIKLLDKNIKIAKFEISCGMIRVKDSKNKYGYIDSNFELKIPCIYEYASCFKDDMAIVELDSNEIGILNKEGKCISFSRKNKYKNIKGFSEGLSVVENIDGKFGYIDKNGVEVIECKYKEASDFSEGLAAVTDYEGKKYYIDKTGNKVITFDNACCLDIKSDNNIDGFCNKLFCDFQIKQDKGKIKKKIRD